MTTSARSRIALRSKVGPPTAHEAAKELHGDGKVARFNRRVGLRITLIVGTMWCAWVFAAIALLSLPQAVSSGNIVVIVAWLSSNFLQLVLLPIIIVGQTVQAAAADARAQATYDDADAVLHTALEIEEHLAAQDEQLADIARRLKSAEG